MEPSHVEKIMSSAQTGDILFFRTKIKWYSPGDWAGYLVRVFNRTYYNHVGVCIEVWGVNFLMEARMPGVIAQPLQDRLADYTGKVCLRRYHNCQNFPPSAYPGFPYQGKSIYYEDINRDVCRQLGKKYDFSSLFWFQFILQVFGIWKGKTREQAGKRFYCSELAAWCYRRIIPEWWNQSPKALLDRKDFITIYETDTYDGTKPDTVTKPETDGTAA